MKCDTKYCGQHAVYKYNTGNNNGKDDTIKLGISICKYCYNDLKNTVVMRQLRKVGKL